MKGCQGALPIVRQGPAHAAIRFLKSQSWCHNSTALLGGRRGAPTSWARPLGVASCSGRSPPATGARPSDSQCWYAAAAPSGGAGPPVPRGGGGAEELPPKASLPLRGTSDSTSSVAPLPAEAPPALLPGESGAEATAPAAAEWGAHMLHDGVTRSSRTSQHADATSRSLDLVQLQQARLLPDVSD